MRMNGATKQHLNKECTYAEHQVKATLTDAAEIIERKRTIPSDI